MNVKLFRYAILGLSVSSNIKVYYSTFNNSGTKKNHLLPFLQFVKLADFAGKCLIAKFQCQRKIATNLTNFTSLTFFLNHALTKIDMNFRKKFFYWMFLIKVTSNTLCLWLFYNYIYAVLFSQIIFNCVKISYFVSFLVQYQTVLCLIKLFSSTNYVIQLA